MVTGSVGAILGSQPAKGRKESGGVWAVTCPGRRRFQAVAGTYGQRSGLIHTEEVTGSIPVSPTQLSGQLRSCNWPFLMPVQH